MDAKEFLKSKGVYGISSIVITCGQGTDNTYTLSLEELLTEYASLPELTEIPASENAKQAFKEWWLTDGKLLCGAKNEASAQDIFNIGFKAAAPAKPSEVRKPINREELINLIVEIAKDGIACEEDACGLELYFIGEAAAGKILDTILGHLTNHLPEGKTNVLTDEALDEIDDVLAHLEDYIHGKDGKRITSARKLIGTLKTSIHQAELVNDSHVRIIW